VWQDKLVDVLQIASILSAAGFAAFALFTDFKKDGRITTHGRIAIIGIVLSALFSLGTQWGKDEIDRLGKIERGAQEQVERDAELGRYRDQISRFVGLSNEQQGLSNRQIEALDLAQGLNRRMQLSLSTQQAVLTGNRRLSANMATSLAAQEDLRLQAELALGGINATRSQVDSGTTHTLQAMWNNANRIDPTGIQVILAYTCRAGRGDFPPLLERRAFAQLGLRPAIAVDDSDFRESLDFSPAFSSGATELAAFQRETSARRITFAGRNDLMHVTTFSLFLPGREDSNHPFRDPEAWRNAGIEVIIFARLEMSPEALARRMQTWEAGGWLRQYSLPADQLNNPRYRVSALPCATNLTVTANGRTVISQNPQMMLISGWTNFEQPTVIVRSDPHRISSDAFPRFPTELP